MYFCAGDVFVYVWRSRTHIPSYPEVNISVVVLGHKPVKCVFLFFIVLSSFCIFVCLFFVYFIFCAFYFCVLYVCVLEQCVCVSLTFQNAHLCTIWRVFTLVTNWPSYFIHTGKQIPVWWLHNFFFHSIWTMSHIGNWHILIHVSLVLQNLCIKTCASNLFHTV